MLARTEGLGGPNDTSLFGQEEVKEALSIPEGGRLWRWFLLDTHRVQVTVMTICHSTRIRRCV